MMMTFVKKLIVCSGGGCKSLQTRESDEMEEYNKARQKRVQETQHPYGYRTEDKEDLSKEGDLSKTGNSSLNEENDITISELSFKTNEDLAPNFLQQQSAVEEGTNNNRHRRHHRRQSRNSLSAIPKMSGENGGDLVVVEREHAASDQQAKLLVMEGGPQKELPPLPNC